MSRTLTTHAAFATVAAGFAVVGSLLLPADNAAARLDPGTPVSAEEQLLTAALGAGGDYTAEQRTVILEAADLVCEGIAADVPMVDMTAHLSTAYGLDDTTARTFVTVTASTHCLAAGEIHDAGMSWS